MARDIEEFLRKAAERRQQQKGGGGRQPQQPPRQQPPPRQQQPQPPIRQFEEPIILDEVDAEIVQPISRPIKRTAPPRQKKPKQNLRDQSVADHVKSHINTSGIAQHAEQLGDRIASVHDQVDSRIHQRLDHDITVIDDTPSITDAPRKAIFGKPTGDAAAEIRQLLANPKTVRQAIILNEILKRPNF